MAQKLLFFEDIIDSTAIMFNQPLMTELEKLGDYVFGESDSVMEDVHDTKEDVQCWANDELYKAIANDYCTAFRFKSAFEIRGEGYVGPVMAWFFEPDGAFDDQIVVFTCESNGLFKNPRYVCGLLIDEYDLERLMGGLGKDGGNPADESAEEDEDVEEEEEVNEKEPDAQSEPNKEKTESTDKGDISLKLVSYEGSIIKMMTVLSGIDGIDEESAFAILQKLPAVVLEGVSAKRAMQVGAMLEEAGATVTLEKAEANPVPENKKPKPAPKEPAPISVNPKPAPMEYVDLGLSVKWAKCNLGATVPGEFGDYFAWGETEPYNATRQEDYKYWKKGCAKYNSKDNINRLELADDAARSILGEGWRLPTPKEFEELLLNCKGSKATVNGVPGHKFTSKVKGFKDRWIFLPAAGFKRFEDLLLPSVDCCYWTSSLCTQRPDSAASYLLHSGIIERIEDDKKRYYGLPIRPVTK